ncbi:mutS protein homolog 5-like isoform X2 [Belonocnema kinseyi]|nr:mutS protein homolog 5-like isoform X2 [Belonocnema kinseyi]
MKNTSIHTLRNFTPSGKKPATNNVAGTDNIVPLPALAKFLRCRHRQAKLYLLKIKLSLKGPRRNNKQRRQLYQLIRIRVRRRTQFEALLYEDSSDDEEVLPADVAVDNHELDPTVIPAVNANKISCSESLYEDRENVVLSIVWQNEHLGAAYYNVTTSELFVMDDVIENCTFGIAKTLCRQINPHSLITIGGLAESFLETMKLITIGDSLLQKSDTQEVSAPSSQIPATCAFKLMPKSENSFDHCFSRVQSLKIEGEPRNVTYEERKTYLSSFLNFSSRSMIHALGLLLKYLDREWHRISLGHLEQAMFINISYISLADLMMMDEDSYKALDIVHKRDHPSFFKFGSDSLKKHTISLFSLFNNCQSRLGSQALWKILHHPTTNIQILEKRQQVIAFCLIPGNQTVADSLKVCLKHIHRLSPLIVNKISVPQAKCADWRKLEQTISNVILIADICAKFRNDASMFDEVAESVTPTMHLIKYFIDLLIDFDSTQLRNKFVLNSGVDSVFDELIYISNNLPRILSEWGAKDLPNLPENIETCLMVYIPNIQYLLAVTRWDGPPPDDPEIPGLEYKFTIEGVHHYKTPAARELDEQLGDVKVKISRRQNAIMMKLVKFIVRYLGEILNAIRLCAELDVMLSLYMVARDSNYVRPKMVESQMIAIKRGRHPLKEAFVTSFVPNDTFSGEGSNSLVKILTGPNACGKSIYLKQIALIVFMAHVGSYVPANSATIGVISRITTQILSNNSISLLNASTFLQDIRQINSALYSTTSDSLVIIDEFGRGTSEIDGSALLASVVTHFLERGLECPHIFAATHLHRVLDLLPRGPLMQIQTFEFLQPTDESDIVFLYRLTEGASKLSFAHAVAKHAGLDPNIIKRAIQVYGSKKHGKPPQRLEKTSRDNT